MVSFPSFPLPPQIPRITPPTCAARASETMNFNFLAPHRREAHFSTRSFSSKICGGEAKSSPKGEIRPFAKLENMAH